MSDRKNLHFVESPLYKLEYTARVCHRYFELFFKSNCSGFGVTSGEYVVMDTIVHSPEISQIELARILFKGRSHITQILNSLEKNGFIKRNNGVRNGRKICKTELTAKGIRVYNGIKEISREKFSKMCKYFEDKEAEFVGMLGEIQEILTEGEEVVFD